VCILRGLLAKYFLCISYVWSWRERALGVVAEVSPASWHTNQQATGKPWILTYISPQSGVGSRELNARQRLIVRPVSVPLLCCCSLDIPTFTSRASLFISFFIPLPTYELLLLLLLAHAPGHHKALSNSQYAKHCRSGARFRSSPPTIHAPSGQPRPVQLRSRRNPSSAHLSPLNS
jgi:hypothetical protein